MVPHMLDVLQPFFTYCNAFYPLPSASSGSAVKECSKALLQSCEVSDGSYTTIVQCIQNNSDSLPEQCSLFLGSLFSSVFNACSDDILTYCAAVDNNFVKDCLTDHTSELNSVCSTQIQSYLSQGSPCVVEASSFCSTQRTLSGILVCLEDRLEDTFSFDPSCEAAVTGLGQCTGEGDSGPPLPIGPIPLPMTGPEGKEGPLEGPFSRSGPRIKPMPELDTDIDDDDNGYDYDDDYDDGAGNDMYGFDAGVPAPDMSIWRQTERERERSNIPAPMERDREREGEGSLKPIPDRFDPGMELERETGLPGVEGGEESGPEAERLREGGKIMPLRRQLRSEERESEREREGGRRGLRLEVKGLREIQEKQRGVGREGGGRGERKRKIGGRGGGGRGGKQKEVEEQESQIEMVKEGREMSRRVTVSGGPPGPLPPLPPCWARRPGAPGPKDKPGPGLEGEDKPAPEPKEKPGPGREGGVEKPQPGQAAEQDLDDNGPEGVSTDDEATPQSAVSLGLNTPNEHSKNLRHHVFAYSSAVAGLVVFLFAFGFVAFGLFSTDIHRRYLGLGEYMDSLQGDSYVRARTTSSSSLIANEEDINSTHNLTGGSESSEIEVIRMGN
eukprot:CAMPEP_0182422056 /NCGR_PEP_ID=MMETSP1167-20130531/7644_1 /TAXON_ID=2988 /ORGANISM="Mallomonas Sp, Strain CCMP3275" /LENGTH=613 /DNA_ID=CAMNT_0024599781 /DNA_START=372 /DNA_END=2213 /DNA_ORIENTATION=+